MRRIRHSQAVTAWSFVTIVCASAATSACVSRAFHAESSAKAVETGVPLRILETVPANGATDVPNNLAIKVYYNKKLALEGSGNNDEMLELVDADTGAKAVLGESDVVFEGPFVAWITKGVLKTNHTYKVRMKGVKSKEGDDQDDPLEFSFTTSSVSFAGTASNKDEDIKRFIEGAKKERRGAGDAIYRVQGGPEGDRSRTRFLRKDTGVAIDDSGMVFFSMGAGDQRNRTDARHRALEFLVNRGENARKPQDLPALFTFEIGREYGEFFRYVSIPQSKGKEFPSRPQIVDYNQARDQYGVPQAMFEDMLSAVIADSAEEMAFDNSVWDEFPDMRPKADKILEQVGARPSK